MHAIAVPKSQYSEAVIRKSVYWLSESCAWELADEEDAWVITLHADAPEHAATLHRLLNDFRLRESLDAATKGLRAQVIRAALQKLGDAS